MKKSEITVGAHYVAKVSGRLTTVRVDAIREIDPFMGAYSRFHYDVTNLATGRKTTFRSAAKFRQVATPTQVRRPLPDYGVEVEPIRPYLSPEMIAETLDRR